MIVVNSNSLDVGSSRANVENRMLKHLETRGDVSAIVINLMNVCVDTFLQKLKQYRKKLDERFENCCHYYDLLTDVNAKACLYKQRLVLNLSIS